MELKMMLELVLITLAGMALWGRDIVRGIKVMENIICKLIEVKANKRMKEERA